MTKHRNVPLIFAYVILGLVSSAILAADYRARHAEQLPDFPRKEIVFHPAHASSPATVVAGVGRLSSR
jgi:hypothetical protein